MVETAFELMEYLAERGAPYGISAEDIFEQIPEDARSPKVAYEYMQLKDVSHIEPLSQGGNPAGDNWVLEDSSVNRARGAETMTSEEIHEAKVDGQQDAKMLKLALNKTGTVVAIGGVSSVVDAGLAAAPAAIEAANLTSTVATIAPVLPYLVIGGLVAGTAWIGFKVYKHVKR